MHLRAGSLLSSLAVCVRSGTEEWKGWKHAREVCVHAARMGALPHERSNPSLIYVCMLWCVVPTDVEAFLEYTCWTIDNQWPRVLHAGTLQVCILVICTAMCIYIHSHILYCCKCTINLCTFISRRALCVTLYVADQLVSLYSTKLRVHGVSPPTSVCQRSSSPAPTVALPAHVGWLELSHSV